MASLLDLADIRQRYVVLDAARRVQYNPLLPDGTTTERMWATYLHAVMEILLTRHDLLLDWKAVDADIRHLLAIDELRLSVTGEHDERWAWL